MLLGTTREYREAVFQRYPALIDNPAYYRLYRKLVNWEAAGGHANGPLLVPYSYVRLINGCGPEDRNFRAKDFLDAFRHDVLPGFDYRNYWSAKQQLARTVQATGLTKQDMDLLELNRFRPTVADAGHSLTSYRYVAMNEASYERHVAEAEALAGEYGTLSDEALRIMRYHNALPLSTFTRLLRPNLQAAWDYFVSNPAPANYVETERQILQAVEVSPKPVLRPARPGQYRDGSYKQVAARVFEMEPRLGSIRSELRQILMRGNQVFELDLQSSQLALIATRWNVPALVSFLSEGVSIWEELRDEYGDSAPSKDAFKRTLYAVCYGAGEAKLLEEVEGMVDAPQDFVTRFTSIPLIRDLLEARDRRLKEVAGLKG